MRTLLLALIASLSVAAAPLGFEVLGASFTSRVVCAGARPGSAAVFSGPASCRIEPGAAAQVRASAASSPDGYEMSIAALADSDPAYATASAAGRLEATLLPWSPVHNAFALVAIVANCPASSCGATLNGLAHPSGRFSVPLHPGQSLAVAVFAAAQLRAAHTVDVLVSFRDTPEPASVGLVLSGLALCGCAVRLRAAARPTSAGRARARPPASRLPENSAPRG